MRTPVCVRSSVVTFRLSTEEYELLKRASTASNSRSLSEYARQAVLGKSAQSLQKNAPDLTVPVLAECLDRLVARMNELDRKLSAILGESTVTEC